MDIVKPGQTINIPFTTFDSNDPSASETPTGLALGDIKIYKDGGTAERASTVGYTVSAGFSSVTGFNIVTVDLADNTIAGFYAAGSEYIVVVDSVTVDGGVISFHIARFIIGYDSAILNTSIATFTSTTEFTLTDGPAENDALNGMYCIIHDVASKVQMGYAVISDYVGSTKTVTLSAATTYTIAASDNISIMGPAPLQPSISGRSLLINASGVSSVDIAAISGDATAADNLEADYDGTGYNKSNSTIGTTTNNTDMRGTDSAALASNWTATRAGYVDNINGHTAQTGDSYALANGATGFTAIDTVVDAIKIKTDFLPSATAGAAGGIFIAGTNAATTVTTSFTTTFTGNLTGSVASVTGNVDGNVTGSVGSLTGHTAQTGDTFALANGATGFTAIDTVVDSILVDTNELQTDDIPGLIAALDIVVDRVETDTQDLQAQIGTAGAGLTDLGGMSTAMKAEVEAEASDALVAQGLDHLVNAAVTGTDVTDNSIVAKLVSSSATADYDDYVNTTDSLQSIRDKQTNIETDTQNIQTRLPTSLVSGRMSSDMVAISGNTTAADNLEASALGIVVGTCEATPTTTTVQTNLAEATDGHYIGRVVIFSTGDAAGQASDITNYVGLTGTLTITALTTAPSASDVFVIV